MDDLDWETFDLLVLKILADNTQWKTALRRAGGIIVGVQIGQPGNHRLRTASALYLEYIKSLELPEE